jgi:hypothetical protein
MIATKFPSDLQGTKVCSVGRDKSVRGEHTQWLFEALPRYCYVDPFLAQLVLEQSSMFGSQPAESPPTLAEGL